MKVTARKRRKMRAALVVLLASLTAWSGVALANHLNSKYFNPREHMDDMVRGQLHQGFKTKNRPQQIQLHAKVPVDVFSLDLTLPPGFQTPWHWHHGPVLTTVSKGTVTEYDSNCVPHGPFSFQRTDNEPPLPPTAVGDAFLEEVEQGSPHMIKNESQTETAELRLVAIVPKGVRPFVPLVPPTSQEIPACARQPH